MKQLTVSIKLNFANSDHPADAEVETNGVPLTMVMESLNNLVKGLACQIVNDAAEDIPEPEQEAYLTARIGLDRKLLADLIEKAREVNNNEVPRYSFNHLIQFAKWYSGMEESKVIAAYTRYLKEKKP